MSKRRVRIKSLKRFLINIICIFMIFTGISLVATHKIPKEANVSAKVSSKNEVNEKLQNQIVNSEKSNDAVADNKPKEIEVENKVYFKDSLFLGDSIIEAMSFFGDLDEENVMGIIGLTIKKAIVNVDKIKNRNPDKLFIMLGHNDLENNMDMNMNNYTQLIEKLKEKMPNTKIYIQGVLPATEKAALKHKYLSPDNIKNFNDNLKQVCEKENVKFIDLSPMIKDLDKRVYEPDGIHFKEPFYKIWLDYLKINYK
ncbi:GDSL-type esterase/lipase family protein [Clostridium novyi]|uniref:Platelet activating factor acetylhydrolase-like protein n=1 Tax=Clostridium novyi (strain NT) TaxID=386415 RepID=A0PYG5_CLONN|nr:GDSL-type esterase/lipase family protein [Clostridium novyi]ABK60813.1 platelet activating factor acetylhydrolase-like protein [Clostridium novyi NT]KEH86686.1 acetylhydrolase [Clostridium novyi A str. NCTC 538]